MTDPKRGRGRPRLERDDRTTSITVRLPTKEFDAVHTCANDERVTFSDWIRRTLKRATAPRD